MRQLRQLDVASRSNQIQMQKYLRQLLEEFQEFSKGLERVESGLAAIQTQLHILQDRQRMGPLHTAAICIHTKFTMLRAYTEETLKFDCDVPATCLKPDDISVIKENLTRMHNALTTGPAGHDGSVLSGMENHLEKATRYRNYLVNQHQGYEMLKLHYQLEGNDDKVDQLTRTFSSRIEEQIRWNMIDPRLIYAPVAYVQKEAAIHELQRQLDEL